MRPASIRRAWVVAAAAAATTLLVSGCRLSDLAFTQDHRLTVLAPEHRAEVERPVTIRWQMSDFRVAPPGSEPSSRGAGYFGLFVDRPPVRPGATIASAVTHNDLCQVPACTSPADLARQGIYTTTKEIYTLRSVPDLDTTESEQLHTVTIVLLDTAGHRIGESAWLVQFRLPNRSG